MTDKEFIQMLVDDQTDLKATAWQTVECILTVQREQPALFPKKFNLLNDMVLNALQFAYQLGCKSKERELEPDEIVFATVELSATVQE